MLICSKINNSTPGIKFIPVPFNVAHQTTESFLHHHIHLLFMSSEMWVYSQSVAPSLILEYRFWKTVGIK